MAAPAPILAVEDEGDLRGLIGSCRLHDRNRPRAVQRYPIPAIRELPPRMAGCAADIAANSKPTAFAYARGALSGAPAIMALLPRWDLSRS